MIQPLRTYLEEVAQSGKIPGMVAMVVKDNTCLMRESFGLKRSFPYHEAMLPDTIFDLASLSKLTATWLSITRLLGENKITLQDTLGDLFTRENNNFSDVTIAQLLTHTAGFVAHTYISEMGQGLANVIPGILALSPEYPSGTQVIYSDLGYILLGAIVEKITGQTLKAYARSLWDAMDMHTTMFQPPKELLPRIAPTEWNEALQDYKLGITHDENGAWLGGVAGAAGVFSTVDDLANFCSMVQADGMYKGQKILERSWVQASRVNYTKDLNIDRSYGWAIIKNAFDEDIIGHTGYTGTAMYMDQARGITFVLLTNRVHPKREVYADAMIEVRAQARKILWETIEA